MTPKERIDAAAARKAAVEARLTPEVKAAIGEREKAEALEAEASALEAKERAHKLALDVGRLSEKYGPHLHAIDLESNHVGHGTWIIKPANGEVMKAFIEASKQPKANGDAMNRRVAEECVVSWNGVDEDAIDGEAMHALWDTFGAIPTTLGNAAVTNGGFVADLRKSGG